MRACFDYARPGSACAPARLVAHRSRAVFHASDAAVGRCRCQLGRVRFLLMVLHERKQNARARYQCELTTAIATSIWLHIRMRGCAANPAARRPIQPSAHTHASPARLFTHKAHVAGRNTKKKRATAATVCGCGAREDAASPKSTRANITCKRARAHTHTHILCACVCACVCPLEKSNNKPNQNQCLIKSFIRMHTYVNTRCATRCATTTTHTHTQGSIHESARASGRTCDLWTAARRVCTTTHHRRSSADPRTPMQNTCCGAYYLYAFYATSSN